MAIRMALSAEPCGVTAWRGCGYVMPCYACVSPATSWVLLAAAGRIAGPSVLLRDQHQYANHDSVGTD